jgi:hypothetical protein
VAKQTRKQVPAKPVTTHPLFPAVIALWFGALFGLGSLAVRPSLLESLVISSRIDLIVPAAAPPLGITARILVALVLAAIGAGIGIALARRLTRPKLEQRERKRGAGSVVEDSDKLHSGHHYADAAMRAPLSVSEDLNTELAHEDRSQGAGGMAPRRRSLAIEHEEIDFVPHDLAPLPGGVPQILDIGEVRISNEAAEAPLDLSAFSAAIAPDPAPAEPAQYSATPANPVQLDWNNAAPVRPAPGAEPQAPRQVFQSFDEAPTAQSADFDQHQQDMALEIAEAAAAGRQVFGMEPPAQSAEPTRQIFGQAITGDQIDPEFIKAAGFKTSVFDVETPSPLFAPREADHASAATTDSFSVPPAPVIQAYQVPEAYVPPSQLVTSTDTAEAPAKVELVTKPVAQPAPILPSPSGLGMDDLAARLADSMARRRAARSGQLAEEPIETAPAPIQTGTEPAPQVTPVEMARAAEFMAAASEPATESVIGTPAIPAAYVPPISAEPLAPPPPFAAPVQTTFAARAPDRDSQSPPIKPCQTLIVKRRWDFRGLSPRGLSISRPALRSTRNEHDACGVGFVAHIKGAKSHSIVSQALEILKNIDHRGAVGADPLLGDGAGILIQIPDALFREWAMTAKGELPEPGDYAVAMCFLPQDEAARDFAMKHFEKFIAKEGQNLIGWRDVPTDLTALARP